MGYLRVSQCGTCVSPQRNCCSAAPCSLQRRLHRNAGVLRSGSLLVTDAGIPQLGPLSVTDAGKDPSWASLSDSDSDCKPSALP
eukprot:364533-Chlamydomonas_euryale.AAC.4